ncbi:MAG: trehalase family glycosidase [Saprospiraceae bacterium]
MKYFFLTIGILFVLSCNQADSPISKDNAKTQEVSNQEMKLYNTIDSSIQAAWLTSLTEATDELPYPFLSIASGRTIIFYWDSYFTNSGLLFHDNVKQYAKNATDNLLHEVEVYGFVPNASEPWGINRSQPAYLSMMVRDVYEAMESKDKQWLLSAYKTLKKEYDFWMDDSPNTIEKNTTSIKGLVRYNHHASEQDLIELYNHISDRFNFDKSISDKKKMEMAGTYAAEAESGMDFSPRFEGRTPDFIAIDLNSNLYQYEINFDWIKNELGIKDDIDWLSKAVNRKALITTYCWNEERGLFLDYDFINKRHSKVAAATSFSPMYAGLATTSQAERLVTNLSLFELKNGISTCEKSIEKYNYQWGYTSGWPPMHYIMIKALDNYGFKNDAQRIAKKYIDIVAKNYKTPSPLYFTNLKGEKEKRKPGFVYEKYNVKDGTIYDAEYASRPFMGWSTGVYVYAYNYYKALKKE